MKRDLFKKYYYFLFLVLFISVTACNDKDDETPVDDTPALTAFQQQALNYFGDIALGFESGNASEITRRWQSEMRLFVGGNPSNEITDDLNSTISQLNALIEPTASIRIVTDTLQSNAYIYFGTATEYIALFPEMDGLLTNNVGFFNVWWNGDIINRARIFVDTDRINFQQQRSLIKEEVTQSLGLGKDSPLYPTSIFYETATNGGFATEFSDLDREVIRLLYHSRMTIGLNDAQSRSVITNIYLDENGQ